MPAFDAMTAPPLIETNANDSAIVPTREKVVTGLSSEKTMMASGGR
jgi:hypothetical protein